MSEQAPRSLSEQARTASGIMFPNDTMPNKQSPDEAARLSTAYRRDYTEAYETRDMLAKRADSASKIADVLRSDLSTAIHGDLRGGRISAGHEQIAEYGEKSGDPRASEYFKQEKKAEKLGQKAIQARLIEKATRADAAEHYAINSGAIQEAAIEDARAQGVDVRPGFELAPSNQDSTPPRGK